MNCNYSDIFYFFCVAYIQELAMKFPLWVP